HAGQICDSYFLAWTKGRLNSNVLLAGKGATAGRYHSPWGKKDLRKVIEAFGRAPEWRILDDRESRPASTWRSAPFLYLFTTALDRDLSVCRGDGKPPVPVFRLPVTWDVKERLYRWKGSYYHHDNIWLACGALERAAYRQLADLKSQLSVEGRDLCREIETATGVPVYYYLMQYKGWRGGEVHKACPGCDGAWRTESLPEPSRRWWQFIFKCDLCRLVSN
ncbi:MAG TPA: DUF2310 family Zn-ribbon-containing protein, partial [Verrucomicrobiales bacterium]|nr:DUF2310 family Zn-ribbon-containing protein [Verrucomicrobiales bacterium]